MKDKVVLNFEFEIEDWMAFQEYHLDHSRQFKRSRQISTWSVPVLFSCLIFLDYLKGKFNTIGVIVFTVASVLWVIFYPSRLKKMTLKRILKQINNGDNSSVVGPQSLTLTETEILFEKPSSESKFDWSGIKKIKENDSHFFLYVTSISAIIIPKNKIRNEIEEVRAYLESAWVILNKKPSS